MCLVYFLQRLFTLLTTFPAAETQEQEFSEGLIFISP
jgi:hypothetical protein